MAQIKSYTPATPPTATATYVPARGWTRPSTTTLATALRTGGIMAADVLVGVSAQVLKNVTTPGVTGGASSLLTAFVPLPDLPTVSCNAQEQPIILLSIAPFHQIPHLVVSSWDAVPQVIIDNVPFAVTAGALPPGSNITGYSAKCQLFLQTDGTGASAAASMQIRAYAQLFIRRLA